MAHVAMRPSARLRKDAWDSPGHPLQCAGDEEVTAGSTYLEARFVYESRRLTANRQGGQPWALLGTVASERRAGTL